MFSLLKSKYLSHLAETVMKIKRGAGVEKGTPPTLSSYYKIRPHIYTVHEHYNHLPFAF